MELLMFSGNSPRNRDWIYEARNHFSDLFDSTYVQDYRHWETGQPWIDLPHELETLRDERTGFAPEYGIFAKSIGTVVAAQAIEQQLLSPRWLLLCGLPLDYIDKEYSRFAAVLAKAELPITVVHNQDDKVGNAKSAAAYMAASFAGPSDYTFIETLGDTHDYEDYELLRAQLITLRG